MTLTGAGGHTSRPHLTGDVVFALGQVITQVPAILGRRLDPRSGRQPHLGRRARGVGAQRDPGDGHGARARCAASTCGRGRRPRGASQPPSSRSSRRYGVEVEVHHQRGVPPVENDGARDGLLEAAARDVLGPDVGGAHRAVARRRGLRLVPDQGARGDGPPGHPDARRAHATTSTRVTCASTSARSSVGRAAAGAGRACCAGPLTADRAATRERTRPVPGRGPCVQQRTSRIGNGARPSYRPVTSVTSRRD